jgi:Flp pilus assembly protein TadD
MRRPSFETFRKSKADMKHDLKTAILAATLFIAFAPAFAAPTGGAPTAPSSSGPQIDVQESFADGVAALQTKDYKKAEKKFGEVLAVAPKHPEANYYMGLAKAGRGRDKDAARYFKRAIKERETFVEAREQLALVSIRLGDMASAIAQRDAINKIKSDCTAETCDAAFTERADKAIAKIEAAMAAATASETDEGAAKDDAKSESALEESPQTADLFTRGGDAGAARYRAAVSLINQEKYAEAIDDLFLAQAIFGPHPDISNYLGFAHRKLGMMEEARAYYGEALAMNPDHLGANEYLGELYLEIGELDKARKQLAKLDRLCAFGCAEREDLARLVALKEKTRAASR